MIRWYKYKKKILLINVRNKFNNENELNTFNCNHMICDNYIKNELKIRIVIF